MPMFTNDYFDVGKFLLKMTATEILLDCVSFLCVSNSFLFVRPTLEKGSFICVPLHILVAIHSCKSFLTSL